MLLIKTCYLAHGLAGLFGQVAPLLLLLYGPEWWWSVKRAFGFFPPGSLVFAALPVLLSLHAVRFG